MPRGIKSKGSEYALLQMKRAHENKLKEATAHRTRARVVENYMLASRRNDLEVERQNLNNYSQRLPPELQQHYARRINDLTTQIDASKKRYPQFRGDYGPVY